MSFSSANHNEVAKTLINPLNQISQQLSCTLIQVTLSEQFSDEPPPANAGKANQDQPIPVRRPTWEVASDKVPAT